MEQTDEAWRPAGVLGDLLPGDLNDACCWACSGGGDVVCCDGCRAVYHLACINLESLPEEDWFCPQCSCQACKGPCKALHAATSIQSDMIPVQTKALRPRQSPQSKVSDAPGYVCPQQLRLWLQQRPTTDLEGGSTQEDQGASDAAATAATTTAEEADATADQQPVEPRPKRQKRGDPVVSSSNSTSPAPPANDSSKVNSSSSSSDGTYVRCCCCQRCCHVACLPAEQQQQLAAWAVDLADSSVRDQHKNTRGARRMRSPRGKKQQAKQEQEEQQRQQQEQQKQQEQEQRALRPVPPFFCSPGCKQTAMELAKRCAQGVVQLDALADGTPVCWQLIQPAAVAAALAPPAPPAAAASGGTAAAAATAEETGAAAAAAAATAAAAEAKAVLAAVFAGAVPQPAAVPACTLLGTGVAPAYTQQQARVLSQVLKDTQQLMCYQQGPAWEVRTYQHTLPWILSGLRQVTPGGLLDLSHFHVAVLWVGSTLASAAVLRVHGGEAGGVLEVTLAATSPQLQHRRLGRLLVGAVERFALEACKVKQAWMPALGGVVKPCVGVSVLPAWERGDGARDKLRLAPGCSTKLLGLDSSVGSNAAGAAAVGRRRGQAAEDAAQKVPKGVASCWALQLSYGRAANVTDWLQLTKCPLLRYSYVPFVSKRLEPHAMLPAPNFRRQQNAKPPPLPPLPPQMQLQPRFVMPQLLPPPPHMRPQLAMQQQQLPLAPPMQQQQPLTQPLQQQPLPGLADASTAAGAAAPPAPGAPPAAPGTDSAVEQTAVVDSQQPTSSASAAAAAAPAAAAAAPAAVQDSSQQQQQEGESKPDAADGPPAANGAAQQQQQQQSAPTQPKPVSKRQQWKEQVMQQFLAQQRGMAKPAAPQPPQQQQPSQAEPAPQAAAEQPAQDEAPGAVDAPSSEPLADTPMEDAQP